MWHKKCSKAEAKRALQVIKKALDGFPFDSEASESVAIAYLLSLIQVPIQTTAPCFIFDAPTPGTGKSILSSGIASIVMGRCPAPLTYSSNDEEFSKTIFSAVQRSDPAIIFDNINQRIAFGNETLSLVLTGGQICSRVLGKSKTLDILVKAVIAATGNNVALRSDMGRRVLICRLDAGVEKPEERVFKEDFLVICKNRRKELLQAGLTILNAYQNSGGKVAMSAFGSFEDWSQQIRAPLIWLGCADPLDTKPQVTSDEGIEDLSMILDLWSQCFGIVPKTVAEASKEPAFSNVAIELFPGRAGLVDTRAMGRFMSQNVGRLIDGLKFVKSGQRHKVTLWKIEVGVTKKS